MPPSSTAIDFTLNGPSAPRPGDILAAVESAWNRAFGGELNLAPSTPQGQIIASLAAMVAEQKAELLHLANQFNPDVAEGVWQEALGRVYFLERKPALPTVVTCVCTGRGGTVIPGLDTAGAAHTAMVQDVYGQRYQCVSGGIIPGRAPASGGVELEFRAVTPGPVACAAHTVNRIITTTDGWDAVDNLLPGVTGQDEESRAAFEARRRRSVALNGNGSVRAVYARVAAVEGVLDCLVRENPADAPLAVGKVVLEPHSLYVAVAGGADEDIARAIAERKSAGCAMNGHTAHVLIDPDTGAEQIIRWERPSAVPVGVRVSMRATAATPADIDSRVRTAVLANFAGQNDGDRARLGATLYASRFYADVIRAGVSDLVGVKVAAPYEQDASAAWTEAVALEIDQFPTLAAGNIILITEQE